jgi:hypothetical protein
MWFYILLIVLLALAAVWLSRTNLYRHWRRHDAGSDGSDRSANGHYGRFGTGGGGGI